MDDIKTCARCHTAKSIFDFGHRKTARDGLKSHCRTCEAAYQRDNYKDRINVIRERKRLHMARWREDPKVRERLNAQRRGNPEYAQQRHEYNQSVRNRHFFVWRARMWSGHFAVRVSAKDLARLWKQQRGLCALSGKKLDVTAHLDHILAASLGGTHTLENLRWLDPYVNVTRGNMTDAAFIEMCSQVAEHTRSTSIILSPNH